MCQGHIPTKYMRLGANKVTLFMKVDANITSSYLHGFFLCNSFVLPPENEEVGQIRVFVISDHPARFWEVQLAFMHTNHPEEPRGLIPGARC